MVSRKVSISSPERLLKIIDRNAKSVGLSRSEYIARILEENLELLKSLKCIQLCCGSLG